MNGKYVKYSYTQICHTQPKCFQMLFQGNWDPPNESCWWISSSTMGIEARWLFMNTATQSMTGLRFFWGFNVLIGHGEQTYFFGGLKPPRNHVDLYCCLQWYWCWLHVAYHWLYFQPHILDLHPWWFCICGSGATRVTRLCCAKMDGQRRKTSNWKHVCYVCPSFLFLFLYW
jgi:hypothetical protein